MGICPICYEPDDFGQHDLSDDFDNESWPCECPNCAREGKKVMGKVKCIWGIGGDYWYVCPVCKTGWNKISGKIIRPAA